MDNQESGSELPYWAAAAFVARCARRCVDSYTQDEAEPYSARAAVKEAVRLAEINAGCGGTREDIWDEAIEFDGQFFDNYDVIALSFALRAYAEAAVNTLADLGDCVDGGPLAKRNLAAIELASKALSCSFPAGLVCDQSEVFDEVLELMRLSDGKMVALAHVDLALIRAASMDKGWCDEDGVRPEWFGPL